MSMTLPDLTTLRDACTILACDAAREIMRIYAGDLGERTKADKSPVTDADHAAEVIIVAGLRALTGDYPEADAAALLREIHGPRLGGGSIKHFGELKNDGSSACGCGIYSGVFDGEKKADTREPRGRDAHAWG